MSVSDSKIQRHELKFYLNRADYEHARSILKRLMIPDEHQASEDGYFIRSLYFDDLRDSSVAEKLAGVEIRDKFRLRIYDLGQDWAKLERKRKVNDYVQKTSIILNKAEAEEIIQGNYHALLRHPDGRKIYLALSTRYYRPIVLVDYVREAYTLPYNDVRITFDRQLRSNDVDLALFDTSSQTQNLQDDAIIIMEIKFNHFLPAWLTRLLRLHGPVRSAISKYCHGRLKTQDYQL